MGQEAWMWAVMLLVLALLVVPVQAETDTSVEAKSFVNDYATVFSDSEKAELTLVLQQLYDAGAAQYSIVTIPSLGGESIESYSLRLAQGKLGDSSDNGLLLLVAVEDHQYRFEVGRGLEAKLNDAKVGRIGRTYLVPYFRQEQYGRGIIEASKAVESVLLGQTSSSYYQTLEQQVSASPVQAAAPAILVQGLLGFGFWLGVSMFLILGIMITALVLMVRAKKLKGKYYHAALGAAHMRSGFSSSGFSSGSGMSRSFGGGHFGGGGSSGRW